MFSRTSPSRTAAGARRSRPASAEGGATPGHSRHRCGSSCPRTWSRRTGASAHWTAPRGECRCWRVPRPGTPRKGRWRYVRPVPAPSRPPMAASRLQSLGDRAPGPVRASRAVQPSAGASGALALPVLAANRAKGGCLRCSWKVAPRGSRSGVTT